VKPGAQSHTRCDLPTQEARRHAEHTVRKRALAFIRVVRFTGGTPAQAADLIGLKPGTLTEWRREMSSGRLGPRKLGRPRVKLSRDVHEVVMALFIVAGGGINYPLLRSLFPFEKPAALKETHQRFTRLGRRAKRLSLATLRWNRVGRVWAMDFFYALDGKPIDNRYKYVLVVRDLVSGAVLLALPCMDRSAASVILALRYLFAAYGPPLVLKTDNEFDADSMVEFLAHNRVTHLLSPPEFPRYNGAIEAGIGSLKTHVYYEAAVHGHPEEWSSNDVEAGRLRANELARPNGFFGASPGRRFDSRRTISEEERAAFEAALQKQEAEVLAQRGLLPFAPLQRQERNAVRRAAIALALVDQSILQIRRRRFTPPFKLRFS
jgi:transposase InsO family protein